MSTIMTPPAGIIRPDVVGLYSVPELFADGGLCVQGDPFCETIFYRRYSDEDRVAVMRVIMPRQSMPEDGHDASLIRAYLEAVRGVQN